MAEVLIKYKADAGDLEATVNKINEVNNEAVKSAQKASDKIATEFKGAGKSIAAAFSGSEVKKALAEQTKAFDDLNKKTVPLSQVLRGIRNELNQLEEEGKSGTEQFKRLSIEAARLEDQMGDLRQRVSILASDTFKFDAAIGALSGLAAGFQVVEGASALFGEENEELQKSLLKLNAVVAIATGLEQINKLVKEESATKTALLTAKQAIYTTVVGTSTGALKAFRIALAATGVGLLVFGLIALVQNFDKVKAALENSIPGFKTVSNAIGDVVDTIKEWVGASDEAERAGAAFENASKRQADATKAIVDGYNRRIAVEKAAGKNTTQLEVEREKAVIAANQKILKDFQAKQSKILDLDKEERDKLLETQKEASDAVQEASNNILVIRATAAKEAADKQKEESKKAAEAEKKAAEEVTKAREQLAKLEQDAYASSVDEREKILAESNTKIAELEQAFIDSKFTKGSEEETKLQNAIQAIKQDATKQIADIDQKALEEKIAKEKEAAAKVAEEQRAAAESSLNTQINLIKQLEIEQGSSLERRIQLINLEAEERKLAVTNSIKDEKERATAIELINAESQKAIREEQKKTRDEQINNALEIAEQTAELFSGLLNLSKEQSQARIEEINQQTEAEIAAINQTSQSEVDKQRQREAAQLRSSRKIAAEKLKQAKLDRAAALFEIGINTAIAVSKSIAASPQTFGLPFSAFAVAQGLIQAGLVLSKPLPKYKRGGIVGGKSHDAGGTIIEAERGEFVVNRNAVSRHRSELDALNTSSAAFRRLIDERYVRPALNYYMGKKERSINVNASLNSKSMEREIKGMRRDLKRNKTIVNFNGNDSRYSWHLN